MTKDSPEILQRVHEGMNLVAETAKWLPRTLGRTNPDDVDDLVSAGRMGLLEAARRYEPNTGHAFSTYARYRIEGAMRDWFRQNHLSRRTYAAVSGSGSGPEAATNRQRLEQLLAGLAAMQTAGHLAQRGLDTQGEPLAVSLKTTPEEASQRSEHRSLIEDCIGTLSTDEAFVVRRHYYDGIPIERIADELGVGRMKTRNIHARALEQLLKLLEILR